MNTRTARLVALAVILGAGLSLSSAAAAAFADMPAPVITDAPSSIEASNDLNVDFDLSGTGSDVEPNNNRSGCYFSEIDWVVDGVNIPHDAAGGASISGGDSSTLQGPGAPPVGSASETTVRESPWSGTLFLVEAVKIAGTKLFGKHTIAAVGYYQFTDEANCADSSHIDYSETSAPSNVITVTVHLAATATPTPLPTADPGIANGTGFSTPFENYGGLDNPSVSQLGSGSAAAPSVLAGLPTIQSTELSPTRLFFAAVVGILFTAILGFSTVGLSQAFESGVRLLGALPSVGVLGKRLRVARERTSARFAAFVGKAPIFAWLAVSVTYLVAILLSAFLDPGFGGNSGSGRLLLSLLAVFLLQSVGGWIVLRLLLKRGGEVTFQPNVNPGMLLVIVLAVILSRILGFEPGLVYGAFLGLTFGATLRGARQARVVLIGSAYVIALSFLSWIIYSIGVALGLQNGGAVGVFVLETLSGLVVAGASGLAIALLPRKSQDGYVVWDWNKWIWAALYAGGAFYALIVLGLLPVDGGEISAPFLGWVIVYLVYGAICLTIWLLSRRKSLRDVPAA